MHVRHWTLVRQVCMILLLVFLLSFTISLFVMHALQKEHLSVLYAQTADLLSVDASTHDAQFHFRTFLASQTLHDFLFRHLNTSDSTVIDGDNAVACKDSHLL